MLNSLFLIIIFIDCYQILQKGNEFLQKLMCDPAYLAANIGMLNSLLFIRFILKTVIKFCRKRENDFLQMLMCDK